MLAVVRDWKLNDQVLEFRKFSSNDDATLSKAYTYPMCYSGSLNPAISSGVFRDDNNNDVETLMTICTYNICLTKLQNRLDMTDQTVFVGVGRKPLEEWRKDRNSHDLKVFKRTHDRLEELLKRDGWLDQEHFLKMSYDIEETRELHEKLGIILNRDPNTIPESLVLNIDDWRILCQWQTKIGGFFVNGKRRLAV